MVDGKTGDAQLVAICDVYPDSLQQLYDQLSKPDIFVTTNPDALINHEKVELVVEAASQEAVNVVAENALIAGKNLMIMSVGALRDNELVTRIERAARQKNVKVYLPSGAICGLDGVKAASMEQIMSIEIVTTKHPRSLEGAPYLVKNNIDLCSLSKPHVVYRGTATEAAKGFPKNVNVAVALSLAGTGVEKTKVTIIADPEATRTKHEIRVSGAFGELFTQVQNYVHPSNPKTSYLAALAAIRTIRNITEPIQVGT